MDFEGFARWVNAPDGGVDKVKKGGSKPAANKVSDANLRQKLVGAMDLLPSIFGSGSLVTKIDYDGLSSAIFNLRAPGLQKLSDREIRAIFELLDTNKSSMVDVSSIVTYAQTGTVALPSIKHSLAERDFSSIPSLEVCIARVCGTDPSLTQKCFSKLPRNSPLKLKFSEFHRLLLTEGLGRNKNDAEELFIALGGDDENSADIGLLLSTIVKMKAAEEEERARMVNKKTDVMEFTLSKQQKKAIAMARGVDFEEEERKLAASANLAGTHFDRTRGRTEGPPLTAGTALVQTIGTSRANRHFRESIRKSYKVVKDECKTLDGSNTGYIDAEQLLRVVNKHCQAIPMEDFRFILQPVRVDQRGRVSWQHFLYVYNPSKAVHPLAGGARTSGNFDATGGLGGTQPLPGIPSPKKNLSRANSPPALNMATATSQQNDIEVQFNKKLKKCWQKLLKECQAMDTSRSGKIDRETFESAVQTSGLEQVCIEIVLASCKNELL